MWLGLNISRDASFPHIGGCGLRESGTLLQLAKNFRIFRTDMILVQLCTGSKSASFRIPQPGRGLLALLLLASSDIVV